MKIIVEPFMADQTDHPIIPGLQFLFICKDESMCQKPKNCVENSNVHSTGTILKDCYFRCKQKEIHLDMLLYSRYRIRLKSFFLHYVFVFYAFIS